MSQISLKRINEENFFDAFQLELRQDQERFVSHPIRSLAQAYVYYQQCTPFGIYCEGTMVGYVMVLYDYDAEEYNILHMMIDKKHQGRGYGKAAMKGCIDYIASKPYGVSNRIVLTCHMMNSPALALYHKFGFIETGNCDDEEIELALQLNN